MGTYKQVKIDANTNNPETIKKIYAEMQLNEAESSWRKYCESTKWWPDDLMASLTTKFPKIMFRLDYRGGNGVGGGADTFYYGGHVVNAVYLLPKFPTKAAFNRGVAAVKKAKEERKKLDKIREIEMEKKKTELEIVKLEERLTKLKKTR